GWQGDGVEIVSRSSRFQTYGRNPRRTTRDPGCGSGHLEDLLRREVVGIGIPRLLARHDSHAATHVDPFGGGLNQRFVNHNRGGGGVLEVEVSVVAALGKRLRKVLFQIGLSQAVTLEEESIRLIHYVFPGLGTYTLRGQRPKFTVA